MDRTLAYSIIEVVLDTGRVYVLVNPVVESGISIQFCQYFIYKSMHRSSFPIFVAHNGAPPR
jgi:hypothetical protein